ncbi:MAG TPA: Tim44 domain-containing protein [Desulfobulbus sp.]|nr:Tim44 domain-containing protein [Desulfobulbus sp.]
MYALVRKFSPLLILLLAVLFVEAGITADYADARSRFGGRSFRRSAPVKPAPAPTRMNKQRPGKSSFGRGLAGGLLGGAIGGLLFGSLFGMGGHGIGILPMLVLGFVGYMFYRKFVQRPSGSSSPGYQPPPSSGNNMFSGPGQPAGSTVPPIPPIREQTLEDGLAMIRQTDPGFDPSYFKEVASDVFFKVQAGWMRRDIGSYRHLLGDTLAEEYEKHFAEMREKGELNKLENIAIRRVEIVDAGNDGENDFVTVLFMANLLDYTVEEKSGKVISGSMTEPVKFAERWTWARPAGTEDWKLEGIGEDHG